MSDGTTPFGFRVGQVEVSRAARYKGYVVIFVETDHQRVEITATPKGRYLRVLGPYDRLDRGPFAALDEPTP
jgi:hypothetical protein